MIHYFISKQKKAQRVIQWANYLRMNCNMHTTKTYLFRRMMTKQEIYHRLGNPENDPCYRKVILQHNSKNKHIVEYVWTQNNFFKQSGIFSIKTDLSIVDKILMEESSCAKHSKTGSVNKAKKLQLNFVEDVYSHG